MYGTHFLLFFLEFQGKKSVISMTYFILWGDLYQNCVTLALIMNHDLSLKRMEFRLEEENYLFRKCMLVKIDNISLLMSHSRIA